jgi:hypothetical protein
VGDHTPLTSIIAGPGDYRGGERSRR